MKLSTWFTLHEMTYSNKAVELRIDNRCPGALLANLTNTCVGLDKIREYVRAPVVVSSGFRCLALNTAIGGSSNSYHTKAMAADLKCPALVTPYRLATKILELSQLDQYFRFHELILEPTWVHVAIALPNERPLKKIGTYKIINGKKTWISGIVK